VLGTAAPLALRYLKDRRSFKPRDAEVGLMLFAEQLPTPRSRVALGPQRDALGQQRLQVDWRIDGRELNAKRHFALALADALQRLKLARVKVHPDLLSASPAYLSRVQDAVHQMGTARIGVSATEGVVDADLRVHGTENLHVAGAAVFPSTGYANPTFTAIALGQRLAAHLARVR
jgi:choline dehydrogenase-like flavoprotein